MVNYRKCEIVIIFFDVVKSFKDILVNMIESVVKEI